jgi:hypothetical protein
MAKRYGKLPSEVLEKASTVDLYCLETAIGYETYLRKSHESGHSSNHGLSQEDMQAMIDRVRGQNDGSENS